MRRPRCRRGRGGAAWHPSLRPRARGRADATRARGARRRDPRGGAGCRSSIRRAPLGWVASTIGSTPSVGWRRRTGPASPCALGVTVGPQGAGSRHRRLPAPAARRARAWYSGPCLRGSAYSRGLSVQYVPDVGPYQAPPSQSGSSGSVGLVVGGGPGPRRPPWRGVVPSRRVDHSTPTRRPEAARRRVCSGSGRSRPRRAPRPADAPVGRCVPGGAPAPPPPVLPPPGGAPRSPSVPRRARPARLARHASPSAARPAARRPARPQAALAVHQLLVRGLDGEEPRQRPLARRVRVVQLREPPVRRADLARRRARDEPEHAVRVLARGHAAGASVMLAGAVCGRSDRQPTSSPTGASSNSGTASAATLPWGSKLGGRW